MRIQLPPGQYTQINTNEDDFLIQNVSEYSMYLIIADAQPGPNTDFDFIIEPKHGISSSHIIGKCWGKPEGRYEITAGLTEG